MNAQAAIKELELAAWEAAEAESHERAARALRLKSARRVAAVHAHLKDALATLTTHTHHANTTESIIARS
jgi:hypothetical protein